MEYQGGNAAGRWTRWVGVGLSLMLGVIVLFGGLGMAEHPLRRVIGWVFVGYGGLRALLNIWLTRKAQSSHLGT